jgi:hypothetical protein
MTITIEIMPRIEAKLASQAAARGMDVRAYVAALLEQAAQPEAVESKEGAAAVDSRIDVSAQPKHQRPPSAKGLAQLFAESPFKGLEMDFERLRT